MFMKIFLKVIGGILGIIVVLGIVFFVVDYNRVKNQEKPIFCIQNTAGMLADGGTIEYFGLGYKVIDFHTVAGFDDIKIGNWFMKYNDFKEEMQKYEMKYGEEFQENNEDKENNINNKVTTIDIQENGLSSAVPARKYTLNQEEIYVIFNIIDNLTFVNETCDGIQTYIISYNSNEKENFISYGIEVFNSEYHITSNEKGEAILSSEQTEKLNEIIKKLNN